MGDKTAHLNLRVLPSVKDALRELASRERRSIANMVEVLILDRCETVGISVERSRSDPDPDASPRKGKS